MFPSRDVNGDLLVIGAGLCRTGTTSLQAALQILYQGKPCYHMRNVFRIHGTSHINRWRNLFDGQLGRPKINSTQVKNELSHLMHGYVASVDTPACLFYKELMEMYPNAKVILTKRPSADWIASCRATVLNRDEFTRWRPWSFTFLNWLTNTLGFPDMCRSMLLHFVGSKEAYADDKAMVKRFEEWNAEVCRYVPANRLLVFEAREGWAPLCQFLGVPVPSEAFPFVGTRDEMIQMFKSRDRLAWGIFFVTPVLMSLIIGGIIKMATLLNK